MSLRGRKTSLDIRTGKKDTHTRLTTQSPSVYTHIHTHLTTHSQRVQTHTHTELHTRYACRYTSNNTPIRAHTYTHSTTHIHIHIKRQSHTYTHIHPEASCSDIQFKPLITFGSQSKRAEGINQASQDDSTFYSTWRTRTGHRWTERSTQGLHGSCASSAHAQEWSGRRGKEKWSGRRGKERRSGKRGKERGWECLGGGEGSEARKEGGRGKKQRE